MLRWALVLLTVGLLLLPRAALCETRIAAPERAPEADCAGFVQQFYNWYRSLLGQHTAVPASTLVIRRRSRFFSRELRRRLAEDRAAERRSHGDLVGLDFDPFTGGSDFADRYVVQGVTRHGQSYWVEVCGVFAREKKKLLTAVAEVRRREGRWTFLNFRYPGEHGAASRDLLTILKQLREERQQPAAEAKAPGSRHGGAPFGYSEKQTLGKSEAEILAMGRNEWASFFTNGDRNTSANQCAAQQIFGLALERRNSHRIAKLPAQRRRLVERVRDELTAFEAHAIEALATAGGDGATWKPVRAGISADVEGVIGRLTGDRGPAPTPRRTGDVTRKLAVLERALREAKTGIVSGEPYSAEYGRKHLRQARSRFQVLAFLLKKAPRSESDLVLGECMDDLEGKRKPFGG